MWRKRDWHEYSKRSEDRLAKHLPPRPVALSGPNRVVPVIGFSLSELDDAGINLEAAELLGLPIDVVRVGTYGPNVSALREFARSARQV
jgi:ribosomal protein L13E